MRQSKRKGIALIAAFGLLVLSGLALAQPEEPEVELQQQQEDDTVFSFGYDEETQVLLFATSDIGEDDPALEDHVEVEVTGPNGQVNHGMLMRAFNSVYEGTGRGCLVRHLAQSDLGKGDHQVKVNQEFEVAEENEVTLSTVETRCERGNGNPNGNGNGNPNGNGNQEAQAASAGNGKPDSPGNSGSAPGRNK